MENVVVVPMSTIADNGGGGGSADVSDDESESINLDLRVSDTEELNSDVVIKKDTTSETEDEILNKFADEEELLKEKNLLNCLETINEDNQSIAAEESQEDLDKTLVNGDKTDCLKEKENSTEINVKDLEIETIEIANHNDEEQNENGVKSECVDHKPTLANGISEDENDSKVTESKSNDEKSSKEKEEKESPDATNSESSKETKDDDNPEEGDLLQVMETTFDEEIVEEKDENSCSSSEKGENQEEPESQDKENGSSDSGTPEAETPEAETPEVEIPEAVTPEAEIPESEIHETETPEADTAEPETPEAETAKTSEDDKKKQNVEENGGQQNIAMAEVLQQEIAENCENDANTEECPMDIEENNISSLIISENNRSVENKESGGEINKEQAKEKEEKKTEGEAKEVAEDTTPMLNGTSNDDDDVTLIDDDDMNGSNLDNATPKPTKRPCPEDNSPTPSAEPSKKMRLSSLTPTPPSLTPTPPSTSTSKRDSTTTSLSSSSASSSSTTTTTRSLNTIKAFMRDKGLRGMTRVQLEELCLQKMCESLADKSELADLRQRIRVLEQAIDAYRKEAATVANQTRDLKIVHEKVTTALRAAKEQKGKHLVPVKITRSVGLQAFVEGGGAAAAGQGRRAAPAHGAAGHSGNGVARTPGAGGTGGTGGGVTVNGAIAIGNSSSSSLVSSSAGSSSSGSNVNLNVNVGGSNAPARTQQQSVVLAAPMKPPFNQRSPASSNGKQQQQQSQKENRFPPPPSPRVGATSQQQAAVATTPRKPAESAAVAASKSIIDLTDDDEKNGSAPSSSSSPTTTTTTTATNAKSRVNGQVARQQATGQTIMMIPTSAVLSTRQLVVKVATPPPAGTNGVTVPASNQIPVISPPKQTALQQRALAATPPTTPSPAPTTKSPPLSKFRHPAPLPPPPPHQLGVASQRPVPPRPHLNLTKSTCGTGIVLQWKMPYQLDLYEAVVSYQLYAYQETKSPPRVDNWGKIGDVKALELPMAVTLTQFAVGNRYHFAVRAVDVYKRFGPFSDPQAILL